MAMILKGIVRGMRPVGGVVDQGERAGEIWHFLSMEITDSLFGNVYSCQVRSNDKLYKEWVEEKVVTEKDESGKSVQVTRHFLKDGKDLTGHRVQATVASITAGEREVLDKEAKDKKTKRKIIQIRTQITNVKDLGEPKDEE